MSNEEDPVARSLRRAGFELVRGGTLNQPIFGKDRYVARCCLCGRHPTSIEIWERIHDELRDTTTRVTSSNHKYRLLPCNHSSLYMGHLPVVTLTRAPAPFWERLVVFLRSLRKDRA